MPVEFWVLAFFICIFLVWNISLVAVDNIDGIILRGHTSSNVISQYARINKIPAEKVVLYKYDGYQKSVSNDLLLSGGRWSISARPVSGDHIHASMSIWVNGIPRIDAEHDRPYIQEVPYEAPFFKNELLCKEAGDIAYTKLWPHSGVHTHCDGLVHIHPWSAPAVFRKEGIDVQLQLWFDQVGIAYREWPFPSVQFKNGSRYDGDQNNRWYLSEKKCFKDEEEIIYERNLNQIWLGHAYASYVLWYGPVGSKSPGPIQSHIESLKGVGAHGYDGFKYPQNCL
jgi:hypothetical protein